MLYRVLPLLSLLTLTFATANTANDVANGVCKPVTLIFARGSTETGNIGTVVGPPLVAAMKQALGADTVAAQGVEYPADIQGAVTGAMDPKNAMGSKNMAMMAMKVATSCPNSKVVLAGYSQGAEQVRGALMNMPAKNNVMAAVTFGDPLKTQAFVNVPQGNTKINCAQGDPVCNSQFIITAAHLSYGMNGDIMDSVKFIQTTMKTGVIAPAAAPPKPAASVAPEGKRSLLFKA